MHQAKSCHETMLQSPKLSELEFIKHVSEQDSGLEIGDEKVAIKPDAKAENASLMDENQTLKNKLEELKVGIANNKQSYEQRIKELEEHHRESLDKIEKESWSLIEKKDLLIFDLRDEILGLKNCKEELASEVYKLELDKQSMEMSHNLVISAVEKNYNQEKKKHQEEVEELREVIKEGEELNTKQEIQIKTLQEELQQINNESKALKESTKTAMEELTNMIIKAEDKFSKAYDDFVEERKSKQTICLKLASEKEELEKQIAILQDANSDLNKEMTCKKEKLEKAKQYKENVENTIEMFQIKIQQQEEKIEELEKRVRRKRGLRRLLSCSG